mmetsp:Transcript_34005/g.56297  ORF Transcript_34005/g.56297 Transcript_34005/m.56297 type:complete len:632 (+) Transcript_34005:19-1914(+)
MAHLLDGQLQVDVSEPNEFEVSCFGSPSAEASCCCSSSSAKPENGRLLMGINPEESVSADYEVLQTQLGRGEFSVVRLGLRKQTHERVAIKLIEKANSIPERLQTEVEILTEISMSPQPNLLRLHNVYESMDEVQLVFELVPGGTLMERLQISGALAESEARRLVRHIGFGLRSLHTMGVVHRDLKLDNIMLDAQGVAKICDFGLAKRCRLSPSKTPPRRFASSPCGTPGFVAPEVLDQNGYDFAVDLWALGIITYVILCGKPPFDVQAPPETCLQPVSPAIENSPKSPSPRPSTSPHQSTISPPDENLLVSDTTLGVQRVVRKSPPPGDIPLKGGDEASASGVLSIGSSVEDSGRQLTVKSGSPASSQASERSPCVPNASRLIARMKRGWAFPPAPERGSGSSEAAKAFVIGCLQHDPSMRLTSDQVVGHPWIIGNVSVSAQLLRRQTPGRQLHGVDSLHSLRAPRPLRSSKTCLTTVSQTMPADLDMPKEQPLIANGCDSGSDDGSFKRRVSGCDSGVDRQVMGSGDNGSEEGSLSVRSNSGDSCKSSVVEGGWCGSNKIITGATSARVTSLRRHSMIPFSDSEAEDSGDDRERNDSPPMLMGRLTDPLGEEPIRPPCLRRPRRHSFQG